ncbi:hypothetical protein EPVG_00135 [Emiliania huxleyi virus 201]|nr:hypothetical protein ELVG_00168 [Emiliania huxleyi virus 203]AEP15864.1 hypothetical protein EQVG_00456 [Emiliania huxleyi virus 207]AEP16308.1 hypothetical protein ERVG_00435 [Emiliania huxleyi virus 208]AET98023.1 hypothetical protein EPVG_00135 [Emiliania huxleyi virus 201]
MLSRVKNAITKINSLSAPKKLLILLVVAIIIVAVLVALDIIPKETVFPSSASQVSIPELQPEPEVIYEPEPAEPKPLVYLGSGACVGGQQEIPEGHCDENPECTAIGRQINGCWHILSGDEPDEDARAKYKWGLFKKTAAGYESLL